jgi:hypothetical protein
MLLAMQSEQWDEAAKELLDSAYAKQVGRRAVRLAQQLMSNQWV